MLPGLFVWSVLIGIFVGSYFIPEVVASFIIIFNVYWVYKTFSMDIAFGKTFFRFRVWLLINWKKRVDSLTNRESIINHLKSELTFFSQIKLRDLYNLNGKTGDYFVKLPFIFEIPLLIIQKLFAVRILRNEFEDFGEVTDSQVIWKPKDIVHIIVVPFANEGYNVLQPTLDHLAKQTLDTKQILVVLATEKACPGGKIIAKRLKAEYRKYFKDVLITEHELKPDEIRGKSANMWYAGVEVAKKIRSLGLNEDLITLTSCDCDSRLPLDYYAILTYEFCKDPNRYTRYWHAMMSYYANIWEVPFYIRVTNTLFTFTAVANQSRRGLIQVSTYSGSYRLIKSLGFWTKDKIPEDWNMFFKAVFKYGDKVSVVPLYTRIMSYAAGADGHVKSIINQYEQVKRWAWGVSDDSWIIKNIVAQKKRFKNKLYVVLRGLAAVYEHFMWPLYGFVLGFGANIPPLISKKFSYSVYGQTLPRTASTILTVSLIIFFGVLILDTLIKPKPANKKVTFFSVIVYFLEIICMPITGILFGTIPALDSHTRLLLGKRLEYRVTEKK